MAEGKLREVEEDAMYIANKRFTEQIEENRRAVEKQAREEAKSKPVVHEELDDKKGK